MLRTRSLAFVCLAAIVAAGCGRFVTNNTTHRIGSEPYTQGSGKVTTISRTMAAFHAVSADNGLIVEVATGEGVDVTADDNLTGLISTEVRDGTLFVTVHGSLETHNELKVRARTTGAIDSLAVTGGATLDAENVSADRFTATADAGATLHAGGRATSLTLRAGAGATADLRNVETQDATASVTAGATAYVRALRSIDGSCETGATLHVLGGPATKSVSASGGATVTYE